MHYIINNNMQLSKKTKEERSVDGSKVSPPPSPNPPKKGELILAKKQSQSKPTYTKVIGVPTYKVPGGKIKGSVDGRKVSPPPPPPPKR